MEKFKPIIGIVAVFVVLPLLIIWLSRRRRSKKDSKSYSELMLSPDFAALETHFGCELPKELKELYADKQEIEKGDFEVLTKNPDGSQESWTVAFYQPAELGSLRECWPVSRESFAFANDGCGNEYLIDPRKAGSEVLFYDHEMGEFQRVASNLKEFIAAPRKNSRD